MVVADGTVITATLLEEAPPLEDVVRVYPGWQEGVEAM